MKEEKAIKLTDNQFGKLFENINQLNYLKEKAQELERVQNDLVSLICEFNKIEMKDIVVSLNTEKKELHIKYS